MTSRTRPLSTSDRKSENARLDCGPRPEGFWNRLNRAISSKPMMTQSARFFVKLFTPDASSPDPHALDGAGPETRRAGDHTDTS